MIVGNLVTLGNNQKVLVLSILEYEGSKYAFVNEVFDEENLTNVYYVLKVLDNSVVKVKDQVLLDVLLPLFSEKIDKIVKDYDFESLEG